MALMKFQRGFEANLPSTMTDGVVYFCKDTGNWYVDHLNESGNLTRSKISAKYADKLRYVEGSDTIEISPTDILTKTNTTAYTPTSDYHPATKKYVDEHLPEAATATSAGLMSAADKAKLDGIATNANKYELPTATDTVLGGVKVGTNLNIDGSGVLSAVDTTYTNASTTTAGLMSAADKVKLDGIATGANNITVDAAISSTSTNPVQNKVISEALDGKSDTGHNHDTAYVKQSQIGVANGVAGLDENGHISSQYIPASVDEIIEASSKSAFPTTGESAKIYVALDTNLTYRWGGSAYVEISPSIAIGTTANTAAAGNHTHNAATTETNGFMSATDKAKLDGIASGANNYTLPTASATELGGIKVGTNLSISNGVLSATDTTYDVATTNTNGLMSSTDKKKLDGVAEGATKVIVDSALNSTSTNAIQNKVVKEALDGKSDTGHTHAEYVNQNAFAHVSVGATAIDADSASDTLTLVAGSNVTITPDVANDKITIAATDTTYVAATTSAAGLMSAADKSKLDGVASGAQVNIIEGVTSESLKVGSITNKLQSVEIEWIEF